MNNQKPEPRAKGVGLELDLHSMFYTIQGEGPYAGHRAIFVRLAGCNLRCPGCDTEYTQGRKVNTIELMVQAVDYLAETQGAEGCLVVITGGEPLRQPVGKFVRKLLFHGYKVQIESNGFFAPDATLDNLLATHHPALTLVVSPKTVKINERTAALASCFKYVLDADSVAEDGLPIMALEHPASTGVARPPVGIPVYLNPFDAKDDGRNLRNLRMVADSCMKHGYILGVQIHKLIGLE